jgi:hypothetical protein
MKINIGRDPRWWTAEGSRHLELHDFRKTL